MKNSDPYMVAEAFDPQSCDALREEMRRFYPDECHGVCKDQAIVDNYDAIFQEMDDWIAENPDVPVFCAKKKYYEVLGAKFKPVIFRNLPFYFEGGINGGWARNNIGVNWFDRHFAERFANTIPQRRISRFLKRNEERFTLCCGFFFDNMHHCPPLTTVLTKGFRGVYEEACRAREKCTTRSEMQWLDAMLAGLEAVHSIQLKFAAEAQRILREEPLTALQHRDMELIAESAKNVPWEKPRTFHEALNMSWFVREILGITDGLMVYSLGHPDAMYKELYDADIASGRITAEEAFRMIAGWLLAAECHHDPMRPVAGYNDHEMEIPVTLGGCDRDGKEVFNDITRMFILAHRRLNLAFPKLHCRCSASSSEEYFRMLADDVYMGRAVHTLFNDDITIPTMVNDGKSLEDARTYICNGCWDPICESRENRYGANYYSLARVLEAMVYHSPELDRKVDFNFTALDGLKSYDEVRDAVIDNIARFAASSLDDRTASECGVVLAFPHPLYSGCLEGCLESRRDESVGGAKYNVTDLDMAFLGNVVDSLLAIREICFEKKICTLHEYLECVRSNWQTRPELRAHALRAPHWGDDTPESSALANRIQSALYDVVHSRRNGRGGVFSLDAWIYREYRFWGEKMRALPDGRRDGDYLAQALNPSSFRTDTDLTTVLNALSRLDHSKFASSNVNLTLEKSNASVEVVMALFRTFCGLKMHMLQPNCNGREEMLDAQKHPERHMNLIVKVCGFSARFVALSPEWQQAILDRHFF